jgi:hypothetical protein
MMPPAVVTEISPRGHLRLSSNCSDPKGSHHGGAKEEDVAHADAFAPIGLEDRSAVDLSLSAL